MEWRSEYETSRTVLYRIVTMLFVLADLAHGAGSRPGPARWLVVRILRKAEGVAREFVFESAGSDEAKDATDLARSFRRLALALRNALRRLRRELARPAVRGGARKGRRRPTRAFCPLFASGAAFAGPQHLDTS